MSSEALSRDELAEKYLEQIPYEPYPVQEEALLAWFSSEQGVLVCAPTGMGKTLIAEAALFEALHTGQRAYYTTPLIALTEQKFREMQSAAVKWGFQPEDVGLVTGNRRENPDARVLVVVAEILFNRLLHREMFDFSDVSAVVMDEFHSFADRERGIVWEFSLGLLPAHVRTLLLSATVGNSTEFVNWLRRANDRCVELVQSYDRKVPLVFQWVPDQLLTERDHSDHAGLQRASDGLLKLVRLGLDILTPQLPRVGKLLQKLTEASHGGGGLKLEAGALRIVEQSKDEYREDRSDRADAAETETVLFRSQSAADRGNARPQGKEKGYRHRACGDCRGVERYRKILQGEQGGQKGEDIQHHQQVGQFDAEKNAQHCQGKKQAHTGCDAREQR